MVASSDAHGAVNAIAGEGSSRDDSYADLYADDGGADEDDDDDFYDGDDGELAEMFAKVQTIQKSEGIASVVKKSTPRPTLEQPAPPLHVDVTADTSRRSGSPSMSSPSGAVVSPSSSSSSSSARRRSVGRSPDGITTLSRRSVLNGHANSRAADILLGVKKPTFFTDKLVHAVKQQAQTLEQLKKQAVAGAPVTIAKRTESLAAPKQLRSERKFACDDDERHCRFQARRQKKLQQARDGGQFNDGDDNSEASTRASDFITRMEAAERNKQKKLEVTRGEEEYMARLSKKVCPRCDVPQSYSEFRDKKKRCQGCGSEFRLPQAWGDIGDAFISRITEDARTREERREQIREQVVSEETSNGRVRKSARQQYYDKQLQQRQDQSFLTRNYTNAKKNGDAVVNNSSLVKTKQAQDQLQKQLNAQRTKRLASSRGTNTG